MDYPVSLDGKTELFFGCQKANISFGHLAKLSDFIKPAQ